MMNQEIKTDGGDDVMGEIIPIKIYGPDLAQTVLTMTGLKRRTKTKTPTTFLSR
jgi:hypothetical protein